MLSRLRPLIDLRLDRARDLPRRRLRQLLLSECRCGLGDLLRLPRTLRLDLLGLLCGVGLASRGLRGLNPTDRAHRRRPELEPGEGGLRRAREVGHDPGVFHAPGRRRPRCLGREGRHGTRHPLLEVGAEVG